jgi:hypothetical protein
MQAGQHDGGQALADLKLLMVSFRKKGRKSKEYVARFGADCSSISRALELCAARFQPASPQALRLQELSCLSMANRGSRNDKNMTEELLTMINTEFFPRGDGDVGCEQQNLAVRLCKQA